MRKILLFRNIGSEKLKKKCNYARPEGIKMIFLEISTNTTVIFAVNYNPVTDLFLDAGNTLKSCIPHELHNGDSYDYKHGV